MGNNVTLKIGGDLGDLEKAFAAFIKKAKSESDKLTLGPAGKSAAPGVDSLREAAQTTRAIGQKVREEKAGLDLINRELARKKSLIDEIAKRQESALKGSREELALAERLTREREKLQRAEKIAQVQRQNYTNSQNAANRAAGIPIAPPGGGSGGGAGGFGGGGPGGGSLGGLSVTSLIGGITAALTQTIGQIAGSASRGIVAGGSAVSGTIGREYSSIYNGNLPNELAFTREKDEAKKMADKQERANRAQDDIREASALGLGTYASALFAGGATAPASLIPAGAAAYAALSSQRMRAKTTSNMTAMIPGMGGISKEQNDEYESLIAQQNAEDYTKNLEAKKQLNPTKVLAVDEYNQNSQRDLDFQRKMGLSNQDFRGGFKTSAFNAGFTSEQAMTSASGIMGAGGSTRSSAGNATLALQAQRNLDMTNASGVIGKLSGGLGGAGTTKEAFVKLLAEGTKVGLDGSDFREENRRFVESAADLISKSGVTAGSGVDQLLSQFGKFFGDRTNAGIEAGKGAFELYRQTSMATTGPRGTMRAAGMLTDPTISSLPRDSREALFNMPIDQLTPDNPAIIAMAQQAGKTPQQLIDAQNKITASSANMFKNSDTARDKLAGIKKKYSLSSSIGYQGPFSPQTYSEIKSALGQSNIAQIKEHNELGQDQRMASLYSDAQASGDSRGMNKALEEAKGAQLGSNTTTRSEDDTNKVRAEMSREVNRIFTEMKDSIVPAADAAAQFTAKIAALNAEMMKIPEPERAGWANKHFLPLFGHAPVTAPSAGAPVSGGGSGSQ